eukprot:TRINITY_DN6882_c0_g1_i1.p1 TRINITY_DN6882_c0_g1~~TRINITY_DN6882_c0_g1_i1.p1  ORF type:complete len:594 (+),score=140.62 TRINITY_DN6882_c0_g1_i1:102-1883(+)
MFREEVLVGWGLVDRVDPPTPSQFLGKCGLQLLNKTDVNQQQQAEDDKQDPVAWTHALEAIASSSSSSSSSSSGYWRDMPKLRRLELVAYCHYKARNESSALILHQELLDALQLECCSDHPDVIRVMVKVAACHETLRDCGTALPLYREALEFLRQKRHKGDNTVESFMILVMQSICHCLGDMEQYSYAIPLARECLQLMEVVQGEKHLDTISFMRHFADGLEGSFEYEEAGRLRSKVVNLRHPSEMHEGLSEDVKSLADCLFNNSDYAGAMQSYRLALGMHRWELSNEIATCLYLMGDYHGALDEYSAAMAALPTWNAEEKLALKFKCARVRKSLGQLNFASDIMLEEIAKYLKLRKPEMYGRAERRINLLVTMASILVCFGDYEPALAYIKDAEEIADEALDETDDQMFSLALVHGEYLIALEKYEEALQLFKKAYDIRRRLEGPLHHETLLALNHFAICQNAMGDSIAALANAEQCLSERIAKLGMDHSESLTCLRTIALCNLRQGKIHEAKSQLEQCLEKGKVLLGKDHPDVLITMVDLASLHNEEGNKAGALELLKECVPLMRAKLFRLHSKLIQAEQMIRELSLANE